MGHRLYSLVHARSVGKQGFGSRVVRAGTQGAQADTTVTPRPVRLP